MAEDVLVVLLTATICVLGLLFVAMKEKDKQNQADNAHLKEQLKQAYRSEAAARMASGAAHDFNNMLSGICGAAECLKQKLAENQNLKKYCDIILSGCEQASHLARQMTRLSLKAEEDCKVMDLAENLEESLRLLEHGLNKKIKVMRRFENKSLFVNLSGEHLQSLILNLGFNAADAMDDKGKIMVGLRRVSLREDDMSSYLLRPRAGDFAEISFADDGTGIAPENMTRIFEPFFTTKKNGKGNGLGLAEVYGTVAAAGGTLKVENKKKGACFYVYLPLAMKKNTTQKIKQKNQKLKAKILVVDDDALQRALAYEILTGEGCKVKIADCVTTAVAICKNDFIPDVLMADVFLPDGEGSKVYEVFKKKNKNLKVVFLSGGEPEDKVKQVLEKDKDTVFLGKPCRAEQVLETLRFLLAKA